MHRNAKLGLAGRYALVVAIERGCSIREAARRHGVSPATACTWSRRWRAASAEEQRTLSCLFDRASRPHRQAQLLPAAERADLRGAARTGHGPRVIAARLGYAHATVWKALRRGGCSRPEPKPREPARRFSGPAPVISSTSTGRRSPASLSPATPSHHNIVLLARLLPLAGLVDVSRGGPLLNHANRAPTSRVT